MPISTANMYHVTLEQEIIAKSASKCVSNDGVGGPLEYSIESLNLIYPRVQRTPHRAVWLSAKRIILPIPHPSTSNHHSDGPLDAFQCFESVRTSSRTWQKRAKIGTNQHFLQSSKAPCPPDLGQSRIKKHPRGPAIAGPE